MKKYKFLLIIVTSFFAASSLCSCGSPGKVNSSEIKVEFTDSVLKASTILAKQTFVRPRTDNLNAIIGQINRLLCSDSLLFVFDRKNNKVVSYDYEGNFACSTNDLIGHAQNEYVHLTDVAIDEETKEIYLYCDIPYQMLILNYNLEVKKCIPMKELFLEIAIDSEYLYALYPDLTDGSKCDVRCYRKDDLTGNPKIIIEQNEAIPNTAGMGRLLCRNGNFIYASLPFDNKIYKISGGSVLQDWIINMGDRWFDYNESKSLNVREFFSVNQDKDWIIQNIVATESEIIFNTNQTDVFKISIDSDDCIGYSRLENDVTLLSNSWLIPTTGRYDISFYIPAAAVVDYYEFYTRREETLPENILNPFIQTATLDDNPLIILGKLK